MLSEYARTISAEVTRPGRHIGLKLRDRFFRNVVNRSLSLSNDCREQGAEPQPSPVW
jgi:hypothetical protein